LDAPVRVAPPDAGRIDTIDTIDGPYAVSGAWWHRGGVARDYYYVHTTAGELRWLYYDRAERAWFLDGRVE
jgi:hypothetical protein